DFPVLLGRNVALPTPLLPDDVRASGKPEAKLALPLSDQPPTRWFSAPEAPLRIAFPFPNGSSIVWVTTSRCATSASETDRSALRSYRFWTGGGLPLMPKIRPDALSMSFEVV